MAVIEVSAGNILNFGWSVSTNIKVLNASNTIQFTAVENQNYKNQSLNDALQLSHTARMTYGRLSVSVVSSLNFFHGLHPRTHVVSVAQFLALASSARSVDYEAFIHALNLNHVLIVQRAKGLTGSLDLDQTVIGNLVRSSSLVDTLAFTQGASVFKMDKTFGVTEAPLPYYDNSTPAPTTVTFVNGSITLTLPRPEIDNGKRFDFTRINRRSRGGDLIIYRDNIWPRTKTLTLTFAWLPNTLIDTILQFLKDSLGKKIIYNDHYGKSWEGFIMTPAAQINFESKNNRNITLEFQGEET